MDVVHLVLTCGGLKTCSWVIYSAIGGVVVRQIVRNVERVMSQISLVEI